MKISKVLFAVFFFIFSYQIAFSQENINSSGGDIQNEGGTVSYSIGQLFFSDDQGDGAIQKGVQLPFSISEVLTVDQNPEEIKLYPNPTHYGVHLNTQEPKAFRYKLYSINGLLIDHQEIINQQTSIVMKELPSGTYILIVSDKQYLPLKSFKIIKN